MAVLVLLCCLSLLPLAPADGQRCDQGIMRHDVNSSSSLLELVKSAHHSFNCSVIMIVPKNFSLSGIVAFEYSFNLSIVGRQDGGTLVSCAPNSGFSFAHSELILLENLVFSGCSMNDTVDHPHLSKDSYSDIAGVYFYQCDNINVTNCHFKNSPGTGFMLHDAGNAMIKASNFSDNTPGNTDPSSNFTHGGMIICLSNNTGKMMYMIDGCRFERNNNSLYDFGGGLTLHFGAANSTSLVNITSSAFVDNEAFHGAGIYINLADNSTNAVYVSNTLFEANEAIQEGGGVWMTSWAVADAWIVLHLSYCTFTGNLAKWGGGLSAYVASGNGRMKIAAQSSNWTGNGAWTSGFAVGLQDKRSCNETFSIEANLTDCWIYNNTFRDSTVPGVSLGSGGATGALYVSGARVLLNGSTEVSNNVGGGVYLRKAAHMTLGGGYLVFSENQAARGGAIHMKSHSALHLAPSDNYTMIMFHSNYATIEGGAIYAELTSDDPCLLNFVTNPPFLENVWFIENYADSLRQKGQSIFVRGYRPNCTEESNNTISSHLLSSPFHYEPASPTNVLFDVTDISVASLPPQDNVTSELKIMLGEKFFLLPTVKDVLGHNTTGIAHIVLTYADPDNNFRPNATKFTYIGPNVIGLDEYTRNNELLIQGTNSTYDLIRNNTIQDLKLGIIFEKNEGGYRDGYANITIKLVPCRLGFVYNPDKEICECYLDKDKDHVLCPNTSSACVRNGYWFGSSDGTSTLLLCDHDWCNYLNQNCPTEQCSTASDFCALPNDQNALCYPGRGHILCSRCRDKYAFTFGALKCVPEETCSAPHTVLILFALVVYWLLIVLLLFIVLSVNLSVGTGFASGIVYYFSVVFLLTKNILTSSPMIFVLRFSTAVTQLDTELFGEIPYCFAGSWTYNVYHNTFNYVTPLFIGVTILAIVWFSRYCNCPRRISLAENSPNHAICLLILVSYTSMTYTSFFILRPIKIGDKTFVYTDPDIPYFHPKKHLPFALVAILVEVVFSLPICFLLLFAPFLSRIKRVNLVKLRLKPIVDEFQACYKDEHRWFAGFYFLARQLMYVTHLVPHRVLPQSNSLLHVVCVFVLLVQTTVRPYKEQFWYLNIIDTVLLTDLLLLALFPINSYVNYSSSLPWLIKEIRLLSPYVLILVPSLYLIGVIGFLIYKRFLLWYKNSLHKSTLTEYTDFSTSADKRTVEDSKPELCDSASFFSDCGEREPLLSETTSDCGKTYLGSMGSKQRSTSSHGFTTSSLRVENLTRFPPAAADSDHKAATS